MPPGNYAPSPSVFMPRANWNHSTDGWVSAGGVLVGVGGRWWVLVGVGGVLVGVGGCWRGVGECCWVLVGVGGVRVGVGGFVGCWWVLVGC